MAGWGDVEIIFSFSVSKQENNSSITLFVTKLMGYLDELAHCS